uniref:Uncharacterized protein n=1 Tax=Rhizophora mucronata TaxID=61149 RepID=A0A2P2L0V4_RHIMU
MVDKADPMQNSRKIKSTSTKNSKCTLHSRKDYPQNGHHFLSHLNHELLIQLSCETLTSS